MRQYQRSMYQTEMNEVDQIIRKVQPPEERGIEWTRKELRQSFYSEKDTSYLYHGAQRSGHARASTSFKFQRFSSGERFIEEA